VRKREERRRGEKRGEEKRRGESSMADDVRSPINNIHRR